MAEWPEFLGQRMVVLDFDKTITNKHTRGAVFQTAAMEPEVLLKNFADLEFFKKIVPIIAQNGILAIATFADNEEEAICSGLQLVRRYLDAALGDSSKYIPDSHIEAWNPENREMDSKAVGKNLHLDALRKRIDPKIKKSQIVLFDDSDRNIVLAAKNGYSVVAVEPARGDDDEGKEKGGPTGFCLHFWQEWLRKEERKSNSKGGCVLM